MRPVDTTGLAAFRILFGLAMAFGSARFLWNGWVDRFFVKPDFFFTYWGFDWIAPLSPTGMTAAFVALVVLSLMVAAGLFYRFAIITFAVLFTYVELIDVTNYLNHYYFVSLVAVIMAFLPAHRTWSLDARLRPSIRGESVPWLAYGWLRFQVAVVWLGAALAKFTPDWLLGAQPLNIWLNARVDTPLIGPYLDVWEVALVASWAGFLYDASVPFLLMWKKSRPFAFAAVLGFHFMTHVWFNIGMFPLIMVVSATVFFSPSWPRRFAARLVDATSTFPREVSPVRIGRMQQVAVIGVAIWCVVQVAMPLRSMAYGGNVNWHEQGMRWAWKVMCREKNGAVTFRVELPSASRSFHVSPRKYLTDHQEREMSGQPDMILQLAHHIADEWRQRGHEDVEVYADAIASLNGRPPKPLIDPNANLAAIDDGVQKADWILQGPSGPPPKIGRTQSTIVAWK
jgi:hypothetical protein